MFDFNKPNIEITDISDDKKYGRFVVEPLERGYGTTLGNSLRRIMLSSLPGSAISQVKIDGVLHEFSSIPGVKEDVTEIIMNLKSLAIKNTSESDEPKTAYIEFEGEGVVTAADIQVDQDIEIMNPETVIATLNGGADSKLYMELTITNGRGYVSADKNKNDELPIAVIPIDSIYTPVERVNLTVENTRVGQITDFDKLTLDVYTNGTLLPDEESIMISDWPVYRDEMDFADAEKAVSSFQEVVRGIRNTRNEMNVPQNRKTNIYIVGKDAECCAHFESCKKSFTNLAFAKEIHVQQDKNGIGEDAVSIVVADGVVYLPLEDLIDREKEIERLTKEQERLTKEIARCEGMLNNPNFVNKAPAAKVEAEKEKLEKYKEMKEKVNLQLTQMVK